MQGIFLNIDINTVVFPFLKRLAAQKGLRREDFFPFVDQYKDTQVTDIAFNVFCQISMTPSAAWSDALASYDRREENGKAVDYRDILGQHARLYRELGFDPYEIWFSRCRQVGISPWLSIRMNDCHCPDEDAVWIRGREFYEADRRGEKIGAAYGYYRHCYNYAVPQVRKRMLAYIEEQLFRYDVDGLELDFSREWFCFDGQDNPTYTQIMTDFVGKVRLLTDRAAAKWGHGVYVLIRLMRDIAQNKTLGFDAEAMVKGHLVDIISVSSRWASNDSDMPISNWKTHFPDTPIYAGITDLTNLKPTTYETTAGLAAAYLADGADKVYLYNYFNDPLFPSPVFFKAQRTCGDLETLEGEGRRIPVLYQDVAPFGQTGYHPLPASAKDFSLSVLTGPLFLGEAATVTVGFDREIEEGDAILFVNGTEAMLSEKADTPPEAPEGKHYYTYKVAADALGETRQTLAVKARDGGLTLCYAEFFFQST